MSNAIKDKLTNKNAAREIMAHIHGFNSRKPFTSNDVMAYISSSNTNSSNAVLRKAWEDIRNANLVERTSVPRGKATTWKRSRSFNRVLKSISS